MTRRRSYEVGYGKPPKSTRFQKGRSGNPAGRPRKNTVAEAVRIVAEARNVAKALETLAKASPATLLAVADLLRRETDG